MTTTLLDGRTTRTSATDALRQILDEVLLTVGADDDADRYSSRTPEGQALLSLATVARRAALAIGADPGVALSDAAGVVVLRELAAAARLLDEAAGTSHGDSWELADLLVRAERLQGRLGSTGR